MKNSLITVYLIFIPLVACAPLDSTNNHLSKVSTGPNNFAFSSDLENGLVVSVNGDNVTTWTSECQSRKTKLSEVEESVRKLIDAAKNEPGIKRDSYATSARINGIRIDSVSSSYGFNGNYESGTFPVRNEANSSMIGIAIVNELVGFVWKCGSIELKPSKCLNDSEWDLVESSRDHFQSKLQEGMRRGMEDLQRSIMEMQRNINDQFKSNVPMNFGSIFGNNFPFGPNRNPFSPFGGNFSPFGRGPSYGGSDEFSY